MTKETQILLDQLLLSGPRDNTKSDVRMAHIFSDAYQNEDFYNAFYELIGVVMIAAERQGASLPASLVMLGFILGARYKEVMTVEEVLDSIGE